MCKMEKAQIYKRINEIVRSLSFLPVDIIIRGDNHQRIIELFIDGEKGITTDDCSNVSRAVKEAIETEGLIGTNYRLDVSSPGVDRSLKFIEQYPKHLNRNFDLTFKEGEEKKTIKAKFIRLEGSQLFFEENKSEYKIDIENIISAKVLTSF